MGAGHAPLRPSPRQQHPLAGARRRQGGARRAQGPAARRAVVHRPLRRGQVDDRQPRREEAARARAATPTCSTATTSATGSTGIWASPTPTGWRTSAASAEVARLMVDAGLIVLGLVHLALPRRAAGWRASCWARASSSRSSSTRRWTWPNSAIAKGLYDKARRGELKNFTGIDSPYEPPGAARAAHRHHDHHPRGRGRDHRGPLGRPGVHPAITCTYCTGIRRRVPEPSRRSC